MEKIFYSTPELAKWLGVFHTTARRWIENGKIKGVRVGRNYKIHADEVIRILENHGVPLPDELIRYERRIVGKRGDEGTTSILAQLLLVDEIDRPAFVCRGTRVISANCLFSAAVGMPQVEVLGREMEELMDVACMDEIVRFAKERKARGAAASISYTGEMRMPRLWKKMVRVSIGPVGDIRGVDLVVIDV